MHLDDNESIDLQLRIKSSDVNKLTQVTSFVVVVTQFCSHFLSFSFPRINNQKGRLRERYGRT